MASLVWSIFNQSQRPSHQPGPAQWTPDAPHKQPFFTFSSKSRTWVSTQASTSANLQTSDRDEASGASLSRITILTWNIDFMRPFADERMSAALSYLDTYLSSSIPSKNAVVILLQEMVTSDLHLIKSASWVKERFSVTDLNSQNWKSGHYGTCTLIDKRLDLKDVFRVHYQATKMGRDALFVDIAFPSTKPKEEHQQKPLTSTTPNLQTLHQAQTPQQQSKEKIIRICNTHLESLRAVPPLRPLQVSTASHFMRDQSIHASMLGGDLNAIEPFDRTLHSDNGLKDAYLELGGKEDSEEGYTWGQMAGREQRERFGCCRMDKVIFAGRVEVKGLERVGMGVQVKGEKEREMLKMASGLDAGWVTDHLGLRVDFEVLD